MQGFRFISITISGDRLEAHAARRTTWDVRPLEESTIAVGIHDQPPSSDYLGADHKSAVGDDKDDDGKDGDGASPSCRNSAALVSGLRLGRHPRVLLLAGGWTLLTLAVAAYALLKPSTTAADLRFLPASWIGWLDANYNLRTLVMTLAILLPPACLLSTPALRRWRRGGLLLCLACLLGFEFAQLWIPTRGFGASDLGYTLAGGLLAELAGSVCQRLRMPRATRPR